MQKGKTKDNDQGDVLTYFYRCRVVSVELAMRVMTICKRPMLRQSTYHMLGRWVKRGTLRRRDSAYGALWEVADKGLKLLQDAHPGEFVRQDPLRELTLQHQLDVATLYLDCIENDLPGQWRAPPSIHFQDKERRCLRPDAAIHVGGQIYAIELDRGTEPIRSTKERRTIERKAEAYRMVTTRGPRDGETWAEASLGRRLSGVIFVVSVRSQNNKRLHWIHEELEKGLRGLRYGVLYLGETEKLRSLLVGDTAQNPTDDDWMLMKEFYAHATMALRGVGTEAITPRLNVLLQRSRETIARRLAS